MSAPRLKAPRLKLSVCAIVLTTLAGCGAGSSNTPPIGGGGNPTIVTFTFTGAAPAAVATQIGNGAYTQATLTANKLTLSVPEGESNFAVVYACPQIGSNPTSYFETIKQANILDATSFSAACPAATSAPQAGLATLQVNAAAIPGAQWVIVGGEGLEWSGTPLDFSEQLAVGTRDFPVAVADGVSPPYLGNYLAIRILRNQVVPGALNGGNPLVFATSDLLSQQTITYSHVPSGYSLASPSVEYRTVGGAFIGLDATGPSNQYLSIPSASMQSGDYYQIGVSAQDVASRGVVDVNGFTSIGGPQSFTFPAPPSYAGPTAAALPSFKMSYSGFSGMSPVNQFAGLQWSQGATAIYFISIEATMNYQNGSSIMSIPDLSALTGFIAPAASGTTVSWNAGSVEGNPFLTTPPSGITQSAFNYGSYTVP